MNLEANVRLAPGTLSQYVIEMDDSYLVSSYPRQTDMTTSDFWDGVPRDTVKRLTAVSLEGSGGYHGLATGGLEFFVLTPDMIGYLWDTIFVGKPRAAVTIRTLHQKDNWVVYNAYMTWPFDSGEYIQQTEDIYSNILFPWERGSVAAFGRAHSYAYSSAYG